jgi:hypothetical protein
MAGAEWMAVDTVLRAGEVCFVGRSVLRMRMLARLAAAAGKADKG